MYLGEGVEVLAELLLPDDCRCADLVSHVGEQRAHLWHSSLFSKERKVVELVDVPEHLVGPRIHKRRFGWMVGARGGAHGGGGGGGVCVGGRDCQSQARTGEQLS